MHSCCWLLGIGSSGNTRSSRSVVGKSSSSPSESISGGGVSSKVRHWQAPWKKGNSSLGHLGVKGEVGHSAPF